MQDAPIRMNKPAIRTPIDTELTQAGSPDVPAALAAMSTDLTAMRTRLTLLSWE